MLWLKSFHIIAMVTWFAGLFYLPRLYVYHSVAEDEISKKRFIIMERKLFFGITTPGGIITTIFGLWMLVLNYPYYHPMMWLHIKLALVCVLWLYHFYLGYLWIKFKNDQNTHSHVYYRWINEVPTVILIAVVILVVVKPF